MFTLNGAKVVLLAVVLMAGFAMPPCCDAGCRTLRANSCVCCDASKQSAPCGCCKMTTRYCMAPLAQLDELEAAVRFDRLAGRPLPVPCYVAKKDTDQTSSHAAMTALDCCVRLSRLTL